MDVQKRLPPNEQQQEYVTLLLRELMIRGGMLSLLKPYGTLHDVESKMYEHLSKNGQNVGMSEIFFHMFYNFLLKTKTI